MPQLYWDTLTLDQWDGLTLDGWDRLMLAPIVGSSVPVAVRSPRPPVPVPRSSQSRVINPAVWIAGSLPEPPNPYWLVLRSRTRAVRAAQEQRSRRQRSRLIRVIDPAKWGVRYYVDWRGLFRIFNAAEYWLYRSNSGPPAESDSPFATASSLPATPSDTYSDGTWYLSVAWFNGVLSSGFLPVGPNGETYLRLDLSGGQEEGPPPIGPISWRLEARPSGVVRVHAVIYLRGHEHDPDQWSMAYTTNGSTPAEDTPDATSDLDATGGQFLTYDLPAQANGTTVKVRLQTRRNDGSAETPDWVYSDNSTVLAITADAAGPTTPLDAETWPGSVDE